MSDDTQSSNDPKKPDPEILPPDGNKDAGSAAIYAEIAAQINQYTDRPDLLLEVVEKHDPGFIKSMNEESREFARESRRSRFVFGKIQAYSAIAISALAALVVLLCLWYLIETEQAGFLTFIGLAIFYAITQGGLKGFLKIIDGVRHAIAKLQGKDSDG